MESKIKYFLLLVFILIRYVFISQNSKTDSLKYFLHNAKEDSNKVNLLNEIAWGLMYENADTSIILSSSALDIAAKTNWKKGIGKSSSQLGVFYELKSDYAHALKYDFMALSTWEKLSSSLSSDKVGEKDLANRWIAKALANIGNVYKEQGDFIKALGYYFKALKSFEEVKNKNATAALLGNIGLVYADRARELRFNTIQHDSLLNKAFQYYFKSLEMKKELGNAMEIAITLGNIGTLYDEQAGGYPKHSLKKDSLYEKAIDFCSRAMEIDEDLGNKNYLALHLSNLGSLYLKQEKFTQAEQYLLKALAVSDSIGDLGGVKDCEENLSLLYSKTGKYAKALEHFKKYIIVRDTITNEDKVKKQTQTEMGYEFDKKEAQTKSEQDKKDAVTKIVIYSISVGLILVLLLAVFIFLSYRQKQKANIIITQQKAEVEKQKHLVEEHQKEIIDSINYAERIQRSFIATKELLDENLKDYFVFFKPKDIVSGDFYWANNLNNGNFILATADSTGHGVPGAIMSLLNITSLEKAIETHSQPFDILNATRVTIIDRLKKDGSPEGGKDGMDCSLISFDFKNNMFTYSAANNPIWVVRENQIIELVPDKMPVGKHDRDSVSFNQNEFYLQKNDVVYALTDGMPDQFGGPKGKKFMYKKMKELLISISTEPMEIQKQKLNDTLNDWKGDMEQVDDITIIGVKI